jgi:hypothetical protein
MGNGANRRWRAKHHVDLFEKPGPILAQSPGVERLSPRNCSARWEKIAGQELVCARGKTLPDFFWQARADQRMGEDRSDRKGFLNRKRRPRDFIDDSARLLKHQCCLAHSFRNRRVHRRKGLIEPECYVQPCA